MTKFLSLFLLGVSAASGAVIQSGITFTINGISQTAALGLPAITSGSNAFRLGSAVTLPGVATVSSLGWSSFDDPFINYFMGVQNLTSTTQTYSFVFTNPYVGGPYTVLNDSFTDSFTDAATTSNGNGTVTIGIPAGTTNIAQPFVDGVNRDGQGVGCTQTGGAGFSGGCNNGPNLTAFPIPATLTAGTFGVAVNFTLSPGDIYTFNGHLDLAGPTVPEPATYTFMAAGLGLLLVGVARQRSRAARGNLS